MKMRVMMADQMGSAWVGAVSGPLCLRGLGQEGKCQWESTPSRSKWTSGTHSLASNSRGTQILELLLWLKRKDKHTWIL